MRITVVSPHLPTPAFPMRGVRHSEQLRLFAEAGHTVRAVVPLPWAPWRRQPREERDGAVPVLHPRYPSIPHRARLAPGALLAFQRRVFAFAAGSELGGAEVVLAHSASLPGGLLGRIGKTPFVVTLHDHELYELAPRNAVVRRIIARTLRLADCVVYVSETLRQLGLGLVGPHENRIIPIGIDTFDELKAVPPECFTICCVTRLIARKRVDRLLRVFRRLSANYPKARMVVIGDGPDRRSLEGLASQLGLDGKVAFMGALDRRLAMEQIARSSVMALPSVMESLGAVYLEAMSLGVPALASAGEGIAAYIEPGVDGILVPPDDDERLYLELHTLAIDPERARRIGEAGRRRFLAIGPTWRANVDAYLALCEELQMRRQVAR